jgi:hypothetical protein
MAIGEPPLLSRPTPAMVWSPIDGGWFPTSADSTMAASVGAGELDSRETVVGKERVTGTPIYPTGFRFGGRGKLFTFPVMAAIYPRLLLRRRRAH